MSRKMVISEFAYNFSLWKPPCEKTHTYDTYNYIYNYSIIIMLLFLSFQLNIIIYINYIIYQIYVCLFSHKRKIVRKFRNIYIIYTQKDILHIIIHFMCVLYMIAFYNICMCVFSHKVVNIYNCIYAIYKYIHIKFSAESKMPHADYEHKIPFSRSHALSPLLLVQPFLLLWFLLSLTSSFPTTFP